MVGSCYCPAFAGERVLWLERLHEDGILVDLGLDILGGDFNMVRDPTLDRTDGGRGMNGRSPGLGIWEEVEQLGSLVDAGRALWGDRRVYTHWAAGLGTRIDWLLSVACHGSEVWNELTLLWCPWSDHWGLLGQGCFGGSGDGSGHWHLNSSLLAIPDLWGRWSSDIADRVVYWSSQGLVMDTRWLRLKAAAQTYWREAGRERGKQRHMRVRWASARMAKL